MALMRTLLILKLTMRNFGRAARRAKKAKMARGARRAPRAASGPRIPKEKAKKSDLRAIAIPSLRKCSNGSSRRSMLRMSKIIKMGI